MTILEARTTVRGVVLPNTYRDSVELMRVAAELEGAPGVLRAALVMATEANREVLLAAGLLEGNGLAAGPNDLLIAVSGEAAAVDAALAEARSLLAGRRQNRTQTEGKQVAPRTVAEAVDDLPEANLALISTPGPYATAEAMSALKRGLDVFLFSDNVSIEDEIELKALARRKGCLLMGPDCGTAILDGIPLGFANVVQPGGIGLIGASGTGLQEVSCLIDRLGQGISQAIGVGGRDLDERVGGSMMLTALERLSADADTRVIVLVSKPPAPTIAQRVLDAAAKCGKPVVVNFLGVGATGRGANESVVHVDTLETAAFTAVALATGEQSARPPSLAADLMFAATVEGGRQAADQHRIVGLYSGGTLRKEADHLLHDLLPDRDYTLIDLGDDEFTVGRPHPMIDARLRSERILGLGGDPRTAVLLLDVVLGYASHPDPAGAPVPALAGARQRSTNEGRYLAVVASVCGTRADPQGLAPQEAKLANAGVLLAPSNAQAARLAALIVEAAR